jgi:hypothetical protein
MIVRTVWEDGTFLRHTLFVWGFRHGIYRTDNGLLRAITKHAHDRNGRGQLPGPAHGTTDRDWNITNVHDTLRVQFGEEGRP